VAVGYWAGRGVQGNYSVAIGSQAGETSQHEKSIIINANNTALNSTGEGFFVRPIRTTASVINTYLAYDEPTKEIQYKTLNAAAVGFSINLDNKLEVVIGGATYRFTPTHVNGTAI